MKYLLNLIFAVLILSSAATASEQHSQLWNKPSKLNNALYNKVLQKLAIKKPVTKNFIQNKKLGALNRTLKSTGVMYIAKTGVCWKTLNPVNSALLLTDNGIVQKGADGKKNVKNADDDMRTGYIVKIMLAMFLAKKDMLEDEFKVFFDGSDNNWQIGLIPQRRMMRKVVKNIIISGAGQVNNITILKTGGDFVSIDISDSSLQGISLDNCVQ